MKAQQVIKYHVSATPDEWLELAAYLPRGSEVRKTCVWMANKEQRDWTTFSPKEYRLVSDAALAACLHIDIIPRDAE